MMLAIRGGLLLNQNRPCAAIRDCTAALKINASFVKAYRIRGTAHRRLGHWKKAHRDFTEAQGLKFDDSIVEMQKHVAATVKKLDIAAGRPTEGAREQQEPPVQTGPLKPLDKGQAVVLCGLKNAPYLNGKRGVVER